VTGVYCRSCEARTRRGAAPPAPPPAEPPHPGKIWGAERISGLRCGQCGALLGADDIAKLLLEKQSQLEQFGLLRRPSHDEPDAPATVGRAIRLVRLEKD